MLRFCSDSLCKISIDIIYINIGIIKLEIIGCDDMFLVTYIEMSLFAIAVLLLIVIQAKRSWFGKDEYSLKLFVYYIAFVIFVMVVEGITWLFDGITFSYAREINIFFTILVCAASTIPSFIWLLFSDYSLYEDITRVKKHIRNLSWILIANGIVAILSPINNLYFSITSDNYFVRGEYIYIAGDICIIFSLYSMFISYRVYRQSRINHETKGLEYVLFPIASMVASIIQSYSYGASLIWVSTAFSIATFYFYNQLQQLTKLTKLEKELSENKISLMLSQIQPHFLYNSLTAIANMSKNDLKVETAIIEFSNYLRGNLEALKSNELISFEKELSHIETYLKIEKMRFEEDLQIIFNIEVSNFLIPVLTIQPLVENAIKHGTSKIDGVGIVSISTKQYDDYIEIVIEDNGVGFDVDQELVDEQIGLKNVENRLKLRMNAKIFIESCIGKGTKVIVHIPGANYIKNK